MKKVSSITSIILSFVTILHSTNASANSENNQSNNVHILNETMRRLLATLPEPTDSNERKLQDLQQDGEKSCAEMFRQDFYAKENCHEMHRLWTTLDIVNTDHLDRVCQHECLVELHDVFDRLRQAGCNLEKTIHPTCNMYGADGKILAFDAAADSYDNISGQYVGDVVIQKSDCPRQEGCFRGMCFKTCNTKDDCYHFERCHIMDNSDEATRDLIENEIERLGGKRGVCVAADMAVMEKLFEDHQKERSTKKNNIFTFNAVEAGLEMACTKDPVTDRYCTVNYFTAATCDEVHSCCLRVVENYLVECTHDFEHKAFDDGIYEACSEFSRNDIEVMGFCEGYVPVEKGFCQLS